MATSMLLRLLLFVVLLLLLGAILRIKCGKGHWLVTVGLVIVLLGFGVHKHNEHSEAIAQEALEESMAESERAVEMAILASNVAKGILLDAPAAPEIEEKTSDDQPRIPLEDAGKATESKKPTSDAEPLPEWVTSLPEGKEQKVLSTEPCTSLAEADAEADRLLIDAVRRVLVDQVGLPESALEKLTLPIDDLAYRFGRDEFLETRETSVGTMHVAHRLVGFDTDSMAWLSETWGTPIHQSQARSTALLLAGAGACVLTGLALTNVLLSLGGRSAE